MSSLTLKVGDFATMYTVHKGRMPNDVHELREWLREFAEMESKRADLAFKIYEEHMMICTRPMIIQGNLR